MSNQILIAQSYGMSHPGKVRPNNEDVFVAGELTRTLLVRHTNLPQPREKHSHQRGYVFLVADGVGGSLAGEVASRLSAVSVEDFLLNTFRRFTSTPAVDGQAALAELQAALRLADARLFDETHEHPQWRGMGTTMTLAVASGRRLFLAHAGDSRCYLFSAGVLRQLTSDHTFAADMLRAGLITKTEQTQHPWRNVVTNLIGGEAPGVQAEVHVVDLHSGDVLLLCSDGLTDMVTDDAIRDILNAEDEPKQTCQTLLDAANANGGADNITAIVARFDEPR